MKRASFVACVAVLLLGLVSVGAAAADGPDAVAKVQAREILESAGVTGGLVVHLGCGDGALTAALRAGDAFTVQGLDPDADKVEAARKRIQSLGLYGPVQGTAESDMTAVVPITGLKPNTRYPYRVLVDGKPIAGREDADIVTAPAESKTGKVRIAFGSCFHRWGRSASSTSTRRCPTRRLRST